MLYMMCKFLSSPDLVRWSTYSGLIYKLSLTESLRKDLETKPKMFRCHGNVLCLILSLLSSVIAKGNHVEVKYAHSNQHLNDDFIKLTRDGDTQLDRLQYTVNSLLDDRVENDKRIKDLEHQVTILHRNDKETRTKLTDLEDATKHLNENNKELRIDQLNNKNIIQACRRDNRKLWKAIKKTAKHERMEHPTEEENTSGLNEVIPDTPDYIESAVMKNDSLNVHEQVNVSLALYLTD